MKVKNIKIIVAFVLSISIFAGGTVVYGQVKESKEYNNMIVEAEDAMKNGDYSKAKELYKKSTSLKSNTEVNDKIKHIDDIELTKNKLIEANELLGKNDLNGALKIIDGISISDEKINEESKILKDKINKVADEEKKEAQAKEKAIKEEHEKIVAQKAEQEKNEDKDNNSQKKTYNYYSNISSSQRNEKLSSPYVTYGLAIDNVVKEFFNSNPNYIGKDVYFHVGAVDGSFMTGVFIDNKPLFTYESNAITGEVISGINYHDMYDESFINKIPGSTTF